MSELDKRVHKALLETNLSNSEIARRCDVARSTVGLWKRGNVVRSDNLVNLCRVLGIDENIEGNLRPHQKSIVRTISSLQPKHDHILETLDILLKNLS
ncbi:helix-turn-helix domain-containing protein [Vibrio ichthyoenteri]|uniref:helix-turn-helix domain-containing protein n=1 Tax=Vibrio ichthyoenteri TaxID=142461 RepID=UPI000587FC1F|nr:helix-turn-helix transcriptional regulator [Vibrio ichthyoenteri]